MRVFSALVVLLLLLDVGSRVPAAEKSVSPEALLPKDAVVYLRYDGLDAHRQAYDQTVLARLMREDLGELIAYVIQFAQDKLGPDVLSEQLLSGATPARLLAFQKAAKEIPTIVEFLQRRGVVVGFELIEPTMPRLQTTLVFPGVGKDEKYRTAMLSIVRLIGLLADVETRTTTADGRSVLSFDKDYVKVASWLEGDHAVLTIGTEDLQHTLSLVSGKRPSLADNAAYRQLASFKRYETCARGLVDFQGLLQLAKKTFPPAEAIGKQLGLSELNSLAFHFGFSGKYQRSTFVLDTSGNRTGLLRLLTTPEPLAINQLPSLPPSLTSVYASRMNWAEAFDTVVDAVKVIGQIADPAGFSDEAVDEQIQRLERQLSIDLRKELLGSLGSRVAIFNAPTQGVFSLGTTLAVEVKDAAKLSKSLESLVKSLSASTGAELRLASRKYRGVELRMLEVAERGFPFTPTYAIHDGWLVVSLFPQPVQAFVMRSGGGKKQGFASWQPPELLSMAMSEARAAGGDKAKITGLSYLDPRPGINSLMGFAPFIAAAASNFSGSGAKFDVSLLPNAHSITDLIGPSVSVSVDDGKMLHIESYSTFPLPIELSGLEVYGIVLGFAFARF